MNNVWLPQVLQSACTCADYATGDLVEPGSSLGCQTEELWLTARSLLGPAASDDIVNSVTLSSQVKRDGRELGGGAALHEQRDSLLNKLCRCACTCPSFEAKEANDGGSNLAHLLQKKQLIVAAILCLPASSAAAGTFHP